MWLKWIFIILITSYNKYSHQQNNSLFTFSIIHINDFHARYDPISMATGLCKTPSNCIGGFSRLYESIKNHLNNDPESILLNAGDNFEGSIWYDTFKWNITEYFFNQLPFDAFTLGNHEFDDQLDGLLPFIKHLKWPIVTANIDFSNEPLFNELINKSVIIERHGKKIGIIGITITTLIKKSLKPNNLVFLNLTESVNNEAERLVKEENVFFNIILSHCGYDIDKSLAKQLTINSKVSIIIGGHTHSFLYTGNNIPGPDVPVGTYPTIIETKNKNILIYQASCYGKYIGKTSVTFNNIGSIISWEGNPIFLNTNLNQNKKIELELNNWRINLPKIHDKIIGSTLVSLKLSKCQLTECLLGNFITNAMINNYINGSMTDHWTYASVAVMHYTGLRIGIDVGDIYYREIKMLQPFKNTIDVVDLYGYHLMEIFEDAVKDNINLLHISGIKIIYNLTKPIGNKIQSFKIRCQACIHPIYEKINLNQTYRIILPSFLITFGIEHPLIKQYSRNRQIGKLDIDVLEKYVIDNSPIETKLEDRIIFLK